MREREREGQKKLPSSFLPLYPSLVLIVTPQKSARAAGQTGARTHTQSLTHTAFAKRIPVVLVFSSLWTSLLCTSPARSRAVLKDPAMTVCGRREREKTSPANWQAGHSAGRSRHLPAAAFRADHPICACANVRAVCLASGGLAVLHAIRSVAIFRDCLLEFAW